MAKLCFVVRSSRRVQTTVDTVTVVAGMKACGNMSPSHVASGRYVQYAGGVHAAT